MVFKKYIHVERFGTDEVDGINVGECYIFPKLDGTNASVWCDDDGKIRFGSRNRIITPEDDNAGFASWAINKENIAQCVSENKKAIFYGEWLVPHSLKTYREDAWRRFYIFDVLKDEKFLHYEEYMPICKKYELDFIPCTMKIKNPTYENMLRCVENNKYLIKENSGFGEGVVIKNYDYKNRFMRTTWAKIVTNNFKDKHIAEMGAPVVSNKIVEEEIANEFITDHLVQKTIAKIRNEHGLFSAQNISQLLSMVYHDLVTEELWQAIKKHKSPKIDFKVLNRCAINRTKKLTPELFGLSA